MFKIWGARPRFVFPSIVACGRRRRRAERARTAPVPTSADPIGDRWPHCRMEYGVYAGAGMHACHSGMRTGNSRMANQRGRTEGSFRNRKSRRFIIPLCCPTNLGLPDTAPGNKFETSVGASVGPMRPPVDAVIAISNLRSSIMIHEAMRMDGS